MNRPSRSCGIRTASNSGRPAGRCWVCERPIGPSLTCPYCEVAQPHRSARMMARFLALAVAFFGTLGIWGGIASRPPDPPLPIARIVGAPPHILARVEGRIERAPHPFRNAPLLQLRDASGVIRLGRLSSRSSARPPSLVNAGGMSVVLIGSVATDRGGTPVFYPIKVQKLSIPSAP